LPLPLSQPPPHSLSPRHRPQPRVNQPPSKSPTTLQLATNHPQCLHNPRPRRILTSGTSSARDVRPVGHSSRSTLRGRQAGSHMHHQSCFWPVGTMGNRIMSSARRSKSGSSASEGRSRWAGGEVWFEKLGGACRVAPLACATCFTGCACGGWLRWFRACPTRRSGGGGVHFIHPPPPEPRDAHTPELLQPTNPM
jgi:hypothetical protein